MVGEGGRHKAVLQSAWSEAIGGIAGEHGRVRDGGLEAERGGRVGRRRLGARGSGAAGAAGAVGAAHSRARQWRTVGDGGGRGSV